MTSLIFALGAIGSYGILYNLLSTTDRRRQTTDDHLPPDEAAFRNPPSAFSGLALLAPLFLLLVSNFEALLEVLHSRGLFWIKDPVTGNFTSSFWIWLDMKELSQPPMQPFG